MHFSDTEIRLAQQLYDEAIANGAPKRHTIAVMVGLSNPRHIASVEHGPSFRDYLPQARRELDRRKF